VAALFDTTVGVLLLRRRPPPETGTLIRAAQAEILAGAALFPAVAASELLAGEKDEEKGRALSRSLARIPTAVLTPEAAGDAGTMGAFLRGAGQAVPLPDLLIAATAVWLELPLLTWDGDYARSVRVAGEATSTHPGALLWRRLRLHPASLGA
jgi:predicted nucleic acid-binding protein